MRLVLDHPAYVGAIDHDNNIAEINAIIQAGLAILAHTHIIPHVTILTDSTVAIELITARVKSNKYVAITKTAQDVLDLARMHGTQIEFIHVRGHTKDEGNDLADELAKTRRKSSLRHIYKHVKPPEELAYQPIMTREINRLRSNALTPAQDLKPAQKPDRPDLQIGENRPILLYHKPSPVKRTSHEWNLHNILKRAPKNDVEQSVHEWSDPATRDRKLGHIQRLPKKPKQWIHGTPEKEHWYHPDTTNEQRQQWRQHYDTLVITGKAESQPNGSFYAITEAAKIHRKRELYQQKYSQQSVTKRQDTYPEPDSQHTEINSPVSSDIEDIDSIIQQSTQTRTGID